MKKKLFTIILLISFTLLLSIISTGCVSLFAPQIKLEIMQMLSQLGEANVEGNAEQIVFYYTDPITAIYPPPYEDTVINNLEDELLELEEMMIYVDCLIDDFSNEEITVLDFSNAIAECDEHTKFQDLFEEGVFYEYLDRIKLTLVKIDGAWKISIYEILSSEDVVPE